MTMGRSSKDIGSAGVVEGEAPERRSPRWSVWCWVFGGALGYVSGNNGAASVGKVRVALIRRERLL